MDFQGLFNISVGVAGALMGWVLNTVWSEIKILRDEDKKLQEADLKLAEKVAQIEVLVAGGYVTRDEFLTSLNALYAKIDKIIDTLSEKANRA